MMLEIVKQLVGLDIGDLVVVLGCVVDQRPELKKVWLDLCNEAGHRQSPSSEGKDVRCFGRPQRGKLIDALSKLKITLTTSRDGHVIDQPGNCCGCLCTSLCSKQMRTRHATDCESEDLLVAGTQEVSAPVPIMERLQWCCMQQAGSIGYMLCPTIGERRFVKSVFEKIHRCLRQHLPEVVEVLCAGSFAKGTDVLMASDLDIIVSLRDYTERAHKDLLRKVARCVQRNVGHKPKFRRKRFYGGGQVRPAMVSEAENIVAPIANRYVHGHIDGVPVDIVVTGINMPIRAYGSLQLSDCHHDLRLAKTLVQFVNSQPKSIKDGVRLAKWWRNSLKHCWDRGCKPFSFLLELLLIAAAPYATHDDALSCFFQMLVLVEGGPVRVFWDFDRGDVQSLYWKEFASNQRILLDPTNPNYDPKNDCPLP